MRNRMTYQFNPSTHEVLLHAASLDSAAVINATADSTAKQTKDDSIDATRLRKLQGKLLKSMRQVCKDYDMIQPNDHIMICVSGGKDSATLLYLMLLLQKQLAPTCPFQITAVHVDQKQPGYNGKPLLEWLQQDLQVPYHIIEEDTYSVVVDKTDAGKSYCTMCSRLRRGILYTTAQTKLTNCTKLALGHHADDAMETMFLNMIHTGCMRSMPARYTAQRASLGVLRPLILCLEADIAEYAQLRQFPILPCNLCSNQANLQRPQIKLLLETLLTFTPDAKKNVMNAMGDIHPSHMLDQKLRKSCGMDPITGESDEDDEMAELR